MAPASNRSVTRIAEQAISGKDYSLHLGAEPQCLIQPPHNLVTGAQTLAISKLEAVALEGELRAHCHSDKLRAKICDRCAAGATPPAPASLSGGFGIPKVLAKLMPSDNYCNPAPREERTA